MKQTRHLATRLGIACALVFICGVEARAAGRYAGCSSRCASGSYGSVRQATYNARPAPRTYGYSSASVGDGQASYSREATRSEASRSGSATYGDGQASWSREVTTAGGKSADISGSATYGDGQASVTREATGSGGKTASRSGSATYGDGHASVTREVTGSGGQTASRETTVMRSYGTHGVVRVGTCVTTLPAGHTTVHVGKSSYHYCGGYYYQPVYVNGVTNYIVVQPPVGTVVDELPSGAIGESVGGVMYYRVGGSWYRPMYVTGQVSYVVVAPPK